MNKVFIDGHAGTTGLLIRERLEQRDDIELLGITDADRKVAKVKQAVMHEADAVILCLPDDAARESVALEGINTRFIDASSAHRTNPAWVYGLPELNGKQSEAIISADRVSNPGCWATAFVLPVAPLIDNGLLPSTSHLSVNGVSGYSGGGRSLIERYETQRSEQPQQLWHSRPYSLGLTHKHLPEMVKYSGLTTEPLFQPSVGHYHQGMLVSIPLFAELFTNEVSTDKVFQCIADQYDSEPCITVHPPNDEEALDQGFMDPQSNNGTNRLDIYIFGKHSQILLISVLDNLGKGASGAAVQNLNLMLGMPELAGLETKA